MGEVIVLYRNGGFQKDLIVWKLYIRSSVIFQYMTFQKDLIVWKQVCTGEAL